ncbi:MAG: TatD family deoxyribonuclease [Deltaproteobacteria bacterium]|nr:TatD family deoxyribonuclease [Deltaproteobacteria bacterium]
MLVDTHCHIDGDLFEADRALVLARARAAGVAAMVNVGCDLPSSRRSLALAHAHDDVWATVGIHPHEAKDAPPGFDEELVTLCRDPRCVAVGECGLDYHYDHSPRAVQREVFARQIAAARRAKKPLVLHVRNAAQDGPAFVESVDILRAEQARDVGGVFHCFTGSAEEAKAALDLGFLLSFPGVVTFKNNGQLSDVARLCPADRFVVETDAPYMAPVPHRGKRNEPAFVAHTAAFVAQVRGEALDDLVRVTGENARRLFGLPSPSAGET